MNKKAIAILGAIFILIVGTLGFLIFSRYSKKPAQLASQNNNTNNNTVSNNNNNNSNNNPSTNNNSNNPTNPPNPPNPPAGSTNAVVQLTTEPVISPVLFFNGQGIAYFDSNGGLYRADLTQLSGSYQLSNIKGFNIQNKSGFDKVLWPKQGDNFIIEYGSTPGHKSWSFFNSSTGSYTDLPPQVEALDWMPDGSKIIYVWVSNNKGTLNIADPDTQNYKKIADLYELDDNINISPDGNSLLFYHNNTASSTNVIKLTTPDGKVWKDLVKDGYNFGTLWSPDSQKFLFNKTDHLTQKNELWLYDLSSGQEKDLGLAVSVNNVVWNSTGTKIYASVTVQNESDAFYQIDPGSLQQKQYTTSGVSTVVHAQNLFLDLNEQKLFFVNQQDGCLYYLDLTTPGV